MILSQDLIDKYITHLHRTILKYNNIKHLKIIGNLVQQLCKQLSDMHYALGHA